MALPRRSSVRVGSRQPGHLPSSSSGSMPCWTRCRARAWDLGQTLPLPPLLESRQVFDGYRSSAIYMPVAAATLSGRRRRQRRVRRPQDSLDRSALGIPRTSGLSLWMSGRAGASTAPTSAAASPGEEAQLPLCRHGSLDGHTLRPMDESTTPGRISNRESIAIRSPAALRGFHRMECLHHDLRPRRPFSQEPARS